MRFRRYVAGSRCWSRQGNMKPSSEDELNVHLNHGTRKENTLVTMKALILPVWGICGPMQRSTIGPQRYTVVEVPSGTLVSMRYFLYLLYYSS